jgi:shikimate dehydrogenase
MNPSGKTKLYGVIGDPVEHSLSPAIQNAAFHELNLDCVFLAFKVPQAHVKDAVNAMKGLGIEGFNVTMPDKKAVIAYLDQVDMPAKFSDSVNTIINCKGKLYGTSTDGSGARQALEKNGVALKDKKLVVLGGGAAARAIAYTLAGEVEKMLLINRSPDETAALLETIREKTNTQVEVCDLSDNILESSLHEADILINATSVGMRPNVNESLVKPNWIKRDLTVLDIVYDPSETRLAKYAKAVGARVINGLEMLIYQGAASFEMWTGKAAPIEIMRQAALNQLNGSR